MSEEVSDLDGKKDIKTISENRQVRHEYFILESFEAGIDRI